MKSFKSPRQVQKFLSIHDQVANLFHLTRREKMPAAVNRAHRNQAFKAWSKITSARFAA